MQLVITTSDANAAMQEFQQQRAATLAPLPPTVYPAVFVNGGFGAGSPLTGRPDRTKSERARAARRELKLAGLFAVFGLVNQLGESEHVDSDVKERAACGQQERYGEAGGLLSCGRARTVLMPGTRCLACARCNDISYLVLGAF